MPMQMMFEKIGLACQKTNSPSSGLIPEELEIIMVIGGGDAVPDAELSIALLYYPNQSTTVSSD